MLLTTRWTQWLRSLTRRSSRPRTVRARPTDFADCGTAFGLDLSLTATGSAAAPTAAAQPHDALSGPARRR